MFTHELVRERLESQARQLGFSLFGIANSQRSPGYEQLLEWIDRGYAGTMSYIPKRAVAYEHPNSVLEGCRSIVMLAMPYSCVSDRASQPLPIGGNTSDCRIGSYASGQVDYHDLIHDRLNQLCKSLNEMLPGSLARGVVDTAPLMERDFAQLSGLGWIGKNTLLLNREIGSYFFLAALLTNAHFEADQPFAADHCGTCTACLDACPTSAFVSPRVLNASRCISYLTIEHRGLIDSELSDRMDNWIFGCDVCQIVCPWNRKVQAAVPPELQPVEMDMRRSLKFWLTLDESSFRVQFRHTPFWRTKLTGMQRNAMIVAANSNRQELIPIIESFLAHHDEVLRETARRCMTKLSEFDSI
ncbi:MAG: tRNA epoxyqueuosine(34) reductase QueG [Pirellula sp.]